MSCVVEPDALTLVCVGATVFEVEHSPRSASPFADAMRRLAIATGIVMQREGLNAEAALGSLIETAEQRGVAVFTLTADLIWEVDHQ